MMNFRNHIKLTIITFDRINYLVDHSNLIDGENEITIIKNPKNNKIYLKINVLFIFIKKNIKKTY